ncbi:phospholipase D family protein [Acinetobacter sp.]|uniref:phospholipase D family protein n=1 Tax=Acinetobacter sp. TaxID=472 RepID=UPI00388EBC96
MSLLTLESENLWEKLIVINEKSPFRSAAVAYFSSDIDLKFIKGDLLIINASPESIQSGATSLDLIEKYLIEGVEIYSNSTLHTKLIIFCEYVYIGSANISRNSKSNLIEAGILTNDKNIIDQSINLIKSIKSDYKTIKIDQAAIDQLKSIKVDRFNILSREKFRLLENNKKYWALGIFQEALYDGDQDTINNQCKLFKRSLAKVKTTSI